MRLVGEHLTVLRGVVDAAVDPDHVDRYVEPVDHTLARVLDNVLDVTPTRTGHYPVECTELCGAGHSLMRAGAFVVSSTAFKTWLGTQKPNGPPPVGVPPKNAAQPGVPGSSTPAKNPAPPKE